MKIIRAAFALLFASVMLVGSSIWAMDEAILTPTNDTAIAEEDKVFNDAMKIWHKHRYSEGEKLLKAFSKKYPNSRWTAEADLHCGCLLTFRKQYDEARPIFERLVRQHAGNNMSVKAKARLGNIAEATGKWDEAIRHYSDMLKMNPRPSPN